MVETYVPLIDQLGEVVKKHVAMVGELQQLVAALKLENANLKARLSPYEPISEDITGLHKEPAEYVYIVADKILGKQPRSKYFAAVFLIKYT